MCQPPQLAGLSADGEIHDKSHDKSWEKREVIRKHGQVNPATSGETDPAGAVLPPAPTKNLLAKACQIQSPLVTSLSITDASITKAKI